MMMKFCNYAQQGILDLFTLKYIFFLEDGDGWEVVRRGRRSHGGSTTSLNSNSNPRRSSRPLNREGYYLSTI